MLATANLVDIAAVYAAAQQVIDAVAPGATLKPLEPTTPDLGPNAVIATATSDEGSTVFAIDNRIEDPTVFDGAAALQGLIDALSNDLDLTTEPAAEAGDVSLLTSHFRASVVASDEQVGELRFSVVGDQPASAEPASEPSEDQAPQQSNGVGPGDGADIASRLPNLAAVDMAVTVELGRVRLPIRELLSLGSGSVVRLGTPIGESFDILVNGKPAARGDLVVVGGKLAVRIRELLGI